MLWLLTEFEGIIKLLWGSGVMVNQTTEKEREKITRTADKTLKIGK